jgi:hypothetical protein
MLYGYFRHGSNLCLLFFGRHPRARSKIRKCHVSHKSAYAHCWKILWHSTRVFHRLNDIPALPPPPIHPLSVLFFYMRKSQIEPNDNVTRDEFPQMKDNKGGQFFNEKSNRYFWSYISLNSSYKQLTCNSRQSVSAGSRIWLGKSQLYLYLFNAMPNSLHYITEERCRNSVYVIPTADICKFLSSSFLHFNWKCHSNFPASILCSVIREKLKLLNFKKLKSQMH